MNANFFLLKEPAPGFVAVQHIGQINQRFLSFIGLKYYVLRT